MDQTFHKSLNSPLLISLRRLKQLNNLDEMALLLATQPHNFEGKSIQGYHAVTRGWYLNEIVRRIDPLHRTIGKIIREDIMPHIPGFEFYLGLPEDLEHRVSPLVNYPVLRSIAKYIAEPLPPLMASLLFSPSSISRKSLLGSSPKQMRMVKKKKWGGGGG